MTLAWSAGGQRPVRSLLSTAAIVAVVVMLASPAAAALPLAGYCNVRTARLASDGFLGMYCNNLNTAAYGYNWTWIDLNLCVTNYNGALRGKSEGLYHASCKNCSVAVDRTSAPDVNTAPYDSHLTLGLRCACADVYGRHLPTTLDLNTVLDDVNGALSCYGHMGNKTLKGPKSH